jgi:hypothetical protein
MKTIKAVKNNKLETPKWHTLVENNKTKPISLKKLNDNNKYYGSLSNLTIK